MPFSNLKKKKNKNIRRPCRHPPIPRFTAAKDSNSNWWSTPGQVLPHGRSTVSQIRCKLSMCLDGRLKSQRQQTHGDKSAKRGIINQWRSIYVHIQCLHALRIRPQLQRTVYYSLLILHFTNSHWGVTILQSKHSLLTYVFPPSGSVTLCFSFISCAAQQTAFYSPPSVLSETARSTVPSLSNQQMCIQVRSVLPALFKVSV